MVGKKEGVRDACPEKLASSILGEVSRSVSQTEGQLAEPAQL